MVSMWGLTNCISGPWGFLCPYNLLESLKIACRKSLVGCFTATSSCKSLLSSGSLASCADYLQSWHISLLSSTILRTSLPSLLGLFPRFWTPDLVTQMSALTAWSLVSIFESFFALRLCRVLQCIQWYLFLVEHFCFHNSFVRLKLLIHILLLWNSLTPNLLLALSGK